MKVAIASIALASGTLFVPTELIEPVARAVVPAIALMATGIFPCMTLTIGAMKAEGRTPALIEELYGQLRGLLRDLVWTFWLAVTAIIALILAIAFASATSLHGHGIALGSVHIEVPQIPTAGAAALLGLLAGRILMLGRAFFAVLEINKKQSLLVARAKVRTERDTAIDTSRRNRFAPDDETPRVLRMVNDDG